MAKVFWEPVNPGVSRNFVVTLTYTDQSRGPIFLTDLQLTTPTRAFWRTVAGYPYAQKEIRRLGAKIEKDWDEKLPNPTQLLCGTVNGRILIATGHATAKNMFYLFYKSNDDEVRMQLSETFDIILS